MFPHRLSLLLTCALFASPAHSQQALPAGLRVALAEWRAHYASTWQLVYDEVSHRGRMLFGGGALPPFVPRNEPEWRLLARRFVNQALPLLGIEQTTLRDDRLIELPLAEVGTTDKLGVRFTQAIQGVPVLHGSVDVLFERETGTLLAIDAQALANTGSLDVTPTLDAEPARSLALRAFRAETGASSANSTDPRLVIAALVLEGVRSPALAWDVAVAGDPLEGRDLALEYLIAAQDAPRVLARRDRIYAAAPQQPGDARGRVLASVTEDGCCFAPDDGTNRVLLPLAQLTVELADGTRATTDADGFFAAPIARSPLALAFQGPFVVVHDHAYWPEGDLRVETVFDPGRALTMNPWPAERNDERGLAEGNADAFALYQMDQPELTYGASTRSGDNVIPFCGDCESRQGCLGEAHADGLPLMGALWKARRNLETELGPALGAALADRLFLGWMNAFDQGQIHSIIEWQWLVLDDDDHDLTNGAPHLAPLDRGFRAQGFPGFELPVTTVICR